MADVERGGDFIMASSADLAAAYVAKEYAAENNRITTTTEPVEYGVLRIELYSKGSSSENNVYHLYLNDVPIGIKGKDDTELSTSDNRKWHIRLVSSGLFRIWNDIRKEGDNERRLQCTKFGYFSESSALPGAAGYSGDVYLFKESTGAADELSFAISEAGFTTLYAEQAFRMPAGATGGIVAEEIEALNAGAEPSYRLTYDWRYGPGTLVPACTPLIIKGEVGGYSCQTEESSEEAPAGNLLHGTIDADGNTDNGLEGQYYYYKLSYKSQEERTLGFWWGAEDGGPFPCGAGKAYLTILQGRVTQVRGFSLGGGETGIAPVGIPASGRGDVYGLDGRLVRKAGANGAAQPPVPGIYIVDGRKVLLK